MFWFNYSFKEEASHILDQIASLSQNIVYLFSVGHKAGMCYSDMCYFAISHLAVLVLEYMSVSLHRLQLIDPECVKALPIIVSPETSTMSDSWGPFLPSPPSFRERCKHPRSIVLATVGGPSPHCTSPPPFSFPPSQLVFCVNCAIFILFIFSSFHREIKVYKLKYIH